MNLRAENELQRQETTKRGHQKNSKVRVYLMKEKIRHIAIGMITVLLLLVAVVSFSNSRIKPPMGITLTAVFNQIDGLNIGDDVRIGGVVIGEVKNMTLGNKYSAVVLLQINHPVKVPKGTSAAIHTDGLFGGKYITLEPGGDEEYIASGGEISMTQGSIVVQDLLELIIGEANSRRVQK
jgi:phospholipid/cholesterol/gamma-HCH transport system substrate-binding protein